MNRRLTEDDALARLESLCARSEHCTFELQTKLRNWDVPSDAAERILASLRDARYLDDERFARAYVREKYLFQRWGRNKIISGLYAKRLPRPTIDSSLDEIETRRYAANAFHLVAAKLRNLPEDMPDGEKRARLIRFATGRGYEMSLIIKILNSRRLWQQTSSEES